MADSNKEQKDEQDRKRKAPMQPSSFPGGPEPKTLVVEKSYGIDGSELPAIPNIECIRDLIDEENCSKPYQKQITVSDEKRWRLYLNMEFTSIHYLRMLNDQENVKFGIPVTVYGPDGKGYKMTFSSLYNGSYVLRGGWTKFIRDHKLEAIVHWVTIWMFRHKNTNDLCFAITWKYLPRRLGLVDPNGRRRGGN